MVQYGLRYTEDDIKKVLDTPQFLAAAHAYSLGILPIGEAASRVAESRPYCPKGLDVLGYMQLFHEVAERIADGRIQLPGNLRAKFEAVYDQAGPKDPLIAEFFSRRDLMYFDELQQPEVRKRQFDLHRREFDENDINALTADRKLLAAIDAYGRGLIDLETLKMDVFGDFNANPRDLDFLSFQRLCFAVVHRIRDGVISLPPGLELEFPQFYRPRDS